MLVVELAPLDEQQLEQLVRHRGLSDQEVAGFMEAIRSARVQLLVERPLDAIWMVDFWRNRQDLGKLESLIEENVRKKLEEPRSHSAKLSLDRVREGAEKLALWAALTNSVAFRVPDDAGSNRNTQALDPSQLLTDWSDVQLKELLERPIFDEATYGQVRFHHRLVQDYLAAYRLRKACNQALSRRELEELLLPERSGQRVVPAHLASVVAWLCVWDRETSRLVTELAPEVLLDQGDPGSLPAEERREVLRAYVKKYATLGRVPFRFDPAGLRRFVSPELADTIAELLGRDDLGAAVRTLLLRLVSLGRVGLCADKALELACRAELETAVRMVAIQAVVQAGTEEQKRRLCDLIQADPLEPSVLAVLIQELFAHLLGVSEVLGAVSRLRPKNPTVWTALDQVLEEALPRLASPDQRRELLQGVLRLARERPRYENSPPVWGLRSWLPDLLGGLLVAELDRDAEGSVQQPWFAPALDVIEQADAGPDTPDALQRVHHAVERHPALRRALLWRWAEKVGQETGVFPTTFGNLFSGPSLPNIYKFLYYHPGRLGASDADWLARDAQERADQSERLLAFDVLVWVWRWTRKWDEAVTRLREVAAGRPELEERLASHGLVETFSAAGSTEQSPVVERLLEEHEQQRADLVAQLTDRIEGIRSGDDLEALWILCNWAWRAWNDKRRDKRTDLPRIAREYGEQLTQAVHDGLRALWRKAPVPRLHDQARWSQAELAMAQLGSAGVTLEVREGLRLTELPPELLRRAVELGACQLNGLPSWLDAVAGSQPELVAEVLAPAIQSDLESREPGSSLILNQLCSGPIEIKRAVAPVLEKLLVGREPGNSVSLGEALSLLEKVGTRLDGSVVEERCRAWLADPELDPERFVVWWCYWANHEPGQAVCLLEQELARGLEKRAGDLVVVKICERLYTLGVPARRGDLGLFRNAAQPRWPGSFPSSSSTYLLLKSASMTVVYSRAGQGWRPSG